MKELIEESKKNNILFKIKPSIINNLLNSSKRKAEEEEKRKKIKENENNIKKNEIIKKLKTLIPNDGINYLEELESPIKLKSTTKLKYYFIILKSQNQELIIYEFYRKLGAKVMLKLKYENNSFVDKVIDLKTIKFNDEDKYYII